MFRPAAFLLAAVISFAHSPSSHALIIEDEMSVNMTASFGTTNISPWTRVRFTETSFAVSGGVLNMATSPSRGLWFGNGTAIGHNPGWVFGSSSVGTYIDISMKLGANSEDWSLYFHDGSGYAGALTFNPAGAYNLPTNFGVSYLHAEPGNVAANGFLPMDLSDGFHRMEVLLKNGMVSYAIDGVLAYSGQAFLSGTQQLLVIGDGSGPTQTGVGSMQVDRVHIDTAPQISTLTSVPVPGALPLLGSALAAAAFMRRRRRDACGAMT